MSEDAAQDAERAARVGAMRDGQQRANRRRTMTWVAATAVLVVALVGAVTWAIVGARQKAAQGTVSPGTAQTDAGSGLTTIKNLTRNHVTGQVTYAQNPPAGGDHSAVWQNCGIYTAPVANENAVHSLEHGAIWITYRPDLPADQVKVLQADLTGQQYGLLSPYPGLPSPVVATVWGVQLKLPSATDPRLTSFITTYADGRHGARAGRLLHRRHRHPAVTIREGCRRRYAVATILQ